MSQPITDALLYVRLAYDFGGGIDFSEKPEFWSAVAYIFLDEIKKKAGNGEGTQEIPLGGGRIRRITRSALI